MSRWEIRRGHGRRCAWVVKDRNGPRNEDARLYFFRTKQAARGFLALMIAEHGDKHEPRDDPR